MILLVLVLIGIGALMNSSAQKYNGTPWIWIISGIGAYFVGQLVAGFIIGLIDPYLLEDIVVLLIVGLLSGFGGVFLVRYLFISYAKKNNKSVENSIDILDDSSELRSDDDVFEDLIEE